MPARIVCLMSFLLFASSAAADSAREHYPMPGMGDLPFSAAVRVGDTLHIAGTGGLLPGLKVPEDPKDEAKLLMESFKATVERAGMTMDDLVSVTIYCPDLSLYNTFNEVYRGYFKKPYPARAFIGSGPLLFGMRFEMMGIAQKSSEPAG